MRLSINGEFPIQAPHEAPWLDAHGNPRTDAGQYTADAAFMAHGNAVLVDDPPTYDPATEVCGWSSGAWAVTAKTLEQLAAERLEILIDIGRKLEDRLEAYIDAVAKAKRYRSTNRLLSYLNSTNVAWRAEAEQFNNWRDRAVLKATTLENEVAAGTRGPLSWEELLDELDDPPWALPQQAVQQDELTP